MFLLVLFHDDRSISLKCEGSENCTGCLIIFASSRFNQCNGEWLIAILNGNRKNILVVLASRRLNIILQGQVTLRSRKIF